MDKPFIKVFVTCPYCGVKQHKWHRVWVGDNGEMVFPYSPVVTLCDCEEYAGCDRYFAYQLSSVQFKTNVYKMTEVYPNEDSS